MRVDVDLTPFGLPNHYERLVVEPSPAGGFVVACLPFFCYGVQFGDRVCTRESDGTLESVMATSGLRTLRVAYRSKHLAEQQHASAHAALTETGLLHEWHGVGYLAVLLRDERDQAVALGCFDDSLARDEVTWEVDPEPFKTQDSGDSACS